MAQGASSGDDVGPTVLSAVERVQAMSLEEVQQLLAKGGRATAIVDGPDGAPRVRRKRDKAVIGGPKDTVRTITLGQLLAAAAAVPALLTLLFLLWWRPHLPTLGGSVAVGLLGGLAFALMYNKNKKRKEQLATLLSQDPGLKGCQYLLGCVPSWISLTDREKMEWFNKMLGELWPYYDRGICKVVKEVVEPIMEMYRPPGIIKKISFSEFTFGTAPFRVEGISVKESDDEIDMELDVRWSGDANIALAIDLPVGGDFTRLNPKVTDIVFVATIKVILKPLVRKIPGFAAIAVALKSPPIINYRLNFGSLSGGSVTTAPITNFVNYIVKEVLVGMLLWPKRFTVDVLSSNGILPANDPAIDLEVERLMGRVRGVVRVNVVRAKGLKSYDTMTGKSDPFVEVYTTPNFKYETKVISNNLEPTWNETFYLPVLEKDQILHLEMYDYDAVNLAGVASTIQIWKGIADSVGARDFMGRSAVRLAPFIAEEGLEEEMWFPLGRGTYTNPQGPGKGEGLVKLGLQYRSLDAFTSAEVAAARKGLLLVGVLSAKNLATPRGDKAWLYAKVKVGKQEGKTPRASSASPRWTYDNKFTFYDVTLADDVSLTVFEPGLAMDDELGTLTLKMPDIIESKMVSRWTGRQQSGYLRKTLPLGDGDGGKVDVEIEFLPHW